MNPLNGQEVKIGCFNHSFSPFITPRVLKIVRMRRQIDCTSTQSMFGVASA